jgi:hypothetical protein
MAIVRRVRSCHGSDCPNGPHTLREGRCCILTRKDYRDGRPSEAWVSGDYRETIGRAFKRREWAEAEADDPTIDRLPSEDPDWRRSPSERLQRKRHTFDPSLPTWYGGGFWEWVAISGAEWPPVWVRYAWREMRGRY